jgi:IS1 family transposase
MANQLDNKTRARVITALVEGNSIRATVRMTGVAKNTIAKLLLEVGTACAKYQDAAFVNLPCKRLEADEIWSFVGAKAKNVPAEKQGLFGYSDVWTWVALDADTKLVPCWHVGGRDGGAAYEFITDLASRLANRVQLTTDGHKAYLNAVENAFGADIDFAMLVKIYGKEQNEIRYSPAECLGAEKRIITGEPNKEHISTSFVERQNLTMRMSMRRFTRLTNAFSKKVENHIAAISLHYIYYNFVRVHQSLRCTPAMAANVTKTLWNIDDMLKAIEPYMPKKETKRGSYKKRVE